MPEGLRAILNEIAREVRLILLIGITYKKNCKIGIFYKIAKKLSFILLKNHSKCRILKFPVLAFFNNFCLNKSKMSGNTV